MPSYVINPWLILPFGILLLAIAIMPLMTHHWWSRHYPKITLGLGGITLFYYLFVLHEFHKPLESLHEYVSFIALIGSLFVITGGIHIRVKGESKPWVNTVMLGIGALLANIIGTTGASMLLIRPYLRSNKYRITAYHVVFFIFIVSNVGGSLTPIADPPLYLGYLQGIPFFWTVKHLIPMWFVGTVWLLIVFYFVDYYNYLRAPADIREKETAHETFKIEGLPNLAWLAVILAALFIDHPMFVREGIMIAAAFMSWISTKRPIYEANHFSWEPVKEVAILFAGIFITMMPALDWLETNAKTLGLTSILSFYGGTGILSAVLDNAPTYLNFFSAAMGLFVDDTVIQGVRHFVASGGTLSFVGTDAKIAEQIMKTSDFIKHYHPELIGTELTTAKIKVACLAANYPIYVSAISIGAVFFGACTYIGNGPNFMVKSIAEQAHVKMPSFFGYIFRYTLPILIPMLIFVGWKFF